jgi:HlyD family secretion protein
MSSGKHWWAATAALALAGAAASAAAQTVEGRLAPTRTVSIGAHVSGPVTEVNVEAGDRVAAGELLARIDPEPFRARVAAAEARQAKAAALAEESGKQLQRKEKIYDRGLSAKRDLEIAQRDAKRDRAAREAAKAEKRVARTELAYTRITAPMDGVVISRHIEPGESVVANLRPPRLFRLAAPLEELHAKARVKPAVAAELEKGDKVTVEVEASDAQLTGTVAVVEPAPVRDSDPPRHRLAVRVANADGELQPGMKVRLEIP